MGKASIRRRLTSKRKVNRKNKKTQRKGKKQTGGRRRPNGAETAGGGAANGNNGNGENYESYIEAEREKEQAYEKMREEAYKSMKEQAIKLIQEENKLEELRALLGGSSLPNHELLIASVEVEKPDIDIIRELISRTEIIDQTHHDISRILEKNPELLTKVFDLLEEKEELEKHAENLVNAAEPNYAPRAPAAGGPPRAVANLVASAKKALAEMPPRRRLRRL